ncbi:hypothetical protein Desti_5144 [Desulfomonile tiedjei DSM 6799]|uniref:Uncharacterized protein n=1 Tax=Desulfomonile tiedjei (strain ATCC 49306 / DSM 6799 / DCB-1) TaxID=706587 RepID=I4CDV6_DESTA|nr:hypothetical protein Desti_5144 [Desulfomonile tiedjei DSM 6799]
MGYKSVRLLPFYASTIRNPVFAASCRFPQRNHRFEDLVFGTEVSGRTALLNLASLTTHILVAASS